MQEEELWVIPAGSAPDCLKTRGTPVNLPTRCPLPAMLWP